MVVCFATSLSSITSFIVSLYTTFVLINISDIFWIRNVLLRETINEEIDDKDNTKYKGIGTGSGSCQKYHFTSTASCPVRTPC